MTHPKTTIEFTPKRKLSLVFSCLALLFFFCLTLNYLSEYLINRNIGCIGDTFYQRKMTGDGNTLEIPCREVIINIDPSWLTLLTIRVTPCLLVSSTQSGVSPTVIWLARPCGAILAILRGILG